MCSKNAFILLLFIIKLTHISSLIIPLHSTKNFSNCNSILDLLDFYKNNRKYTYIQISDVPQKFQIFFTSTESSNVIKDENCFSDSYYNIDISNTVQYDYEQNEKYHFYIKDIISFDKQYSNLLIPFIYYNSTIYEENCGSIGFACSLPKEIEYNLFFELKKLNAIDKSIFYFNYSNNDDMSLNIGFEPFEIDNSYTKNKKVIGIDPILDYYKKSMRRQYNWNLNFSRIFYLRKIPLESGIDPYVDINRMKTRKVKFFQALLVPEEELIKGPFEYQEAIEENFFDKLIADKICTKYKSENKYYFYCKKKHKKLIKNTFPSLYFYQEKLNYMFELTYDDLFIEKGDILFFGIYFDCFLIEVYRGAFISEWYFGKIFFKKYTFGFDFEKNKLIFYKKNKTKKKKIDDKKNTEKENDSKKKIYQLGLILVVITIGVFAFLLDRYARRKYRLTNALIDFDSRQL